MVLNARIPRYRFFNLISSLFVTVFIISNIASSAKIIDTRLVIFGIPLIFDAGTILFPISYIFGDVLTEVYGYRESRRIIWTGFFCMLMTSGVFYIISLLPGEGNWERNVGQENYESILWGITSGALVFASLAAYWCGEFSNSIILAKIKILTKGRFLFIRTISSSLIGQALDTIIFVSIATIFKVPGFIPELWIPLVVTNYVFKCSVEIIMTPATYRVVDFLKRSEDHDHFDIGTNFNPFLMN